MPPRAPVRSPLRAVLTVGAGVITPSKSRTGVRGEGDRRLRCAAGPHARRNLRTSPMEGGGRCAARRVLAIERAQRAPL